MTKKLMVLLDTVLGSTARTVRATVLILVVAVAVGPLHAVELPTWPTPSTGGARPPAALGVHDGDGVVGWSTVRWSSAVC